MNISDFYWHDSIIRNINVDRTNPGNVDTVLFEIQWYDTDEISNVIFQNVYWADLALIFANMGKETISDITIANEDDPDLVECQRIWGMHLNFKLNCYVMNTHFGSKIKIIAQDFTVAPS